MKDAELLVLQVLKTPRARREFLLHVLKVHWADYIGHTAASHSQPYRLEDGVLYVHTDNPMWSTQLHMLQGKLLGTINRELAPDLKGRKRIVKQIRFYHGIIQDLSQPDLEQTPFMPLRDPEKRCPLCGVPLIGDEEICSACRRKKEEGIRRAIRKELDRQPWLSYEDCRKLVDCDKITFTDVKARLEEWALDRALGPRATDRDIAFAVMVNTGVPPEKLTAELVEHTLEKAGRSRYYVPARRK
ncbi:DciA family protein [Acidaminococcus timonensis]|uniref:DciA family protein n=2 Tax=Acidaminococcus timonensis TaxID=1871002 RepID=UPI00307B8EA7